MKDNLYKMNKKLRVHNKEKNNKLMIRQNKTQLKYKMRVIK